MKKITIAYSIILIILLSGILAAEEETSQSAPTEQGSVSYLDNISCSTGEFSVIYKLQEDGAESKYFRRYHDPFEGEPFYIDKFNLFGKTSDDSIIELTMLNTWDPSWQGGFDWKKVNLIHFWAYMNDFNHFEMPDAMPGSRRDMNMGIEHGCLNGNNFRINFTNRESGETEEEGKSESWKTRDIDLKYDFQAMKWNTSFKMKVRNLDNENKDLMDIRHITFTLAGDRDIGDSSFLRGHLNYSISDLDSDKDYKNLGGAMLARFTNAFSTKGLDLTTSVRAQKNGRGPSRMHPLGSTFGLNIGAKYNVNPDAKINASWDLSRIRKSYPNEDALDDFIDNPDHVIPENGEILEYTLLVNRLKLNARYKLTNALDFSSNWRMLTRSGLADTDFFEANSPHLYWNEELSQEYMFRYHPQNIGSPKFCDWELKYNTNDRSNSQRNASDDDSHLTLNWNGLLDDNLWVHAGWGYLKTRTKNIELRDLSGKGIEYGLGFEWDAPNGWNLYADWWKYDVNNTDGTDQTSLTAGIGYKLHENWTVALEYEKDDGEFSDYADLDYDVKLLKLKTSYRW